MLQGFQPDADRIEVNFHIGCLHYGNRILEIYNIEELIGGTIPVTVTAACDTKEIHLMGGPTLGNPDIVLIPSEPGCDYDLKMYLHPNSVVNNTAAAGQFTYYILPGKGIVSVNLMPTEDRLNTGALKQQFVFNASISDVESIKFSTASPGDEPARSIELHFLDHKIRKLLRTKLLRTLDSISFTKSTITANSTVSYQLKSDSSLDFTHFELPRQLSDAQTREILTEHFLPNPVANSFNVTLNERNEIRRALVNLINKTEPKSVGDFRFELKAHLSNNTLFYFADDELKIGNENIYLFHQNLNKTVEWIINKYGPVARRLNLISVLTTQNKEYIVIGHQGREVMHNNPSAETHLYGNGGEGLFVIQPSRAPFCNHAYP